MPKLRAVPHSEKKLIDDHGSTLDVLRRGGVGLRRWENMRVGEAAATTCKLQRVNDLVRITVQVAGSA
jgi:hypothetical protein